MYAVVGFHNKTGMYHVWYFPTLEKAQNFKRTVTNRLPLEDVTYMSILKEVE